MPKQKMTLAEFDSKLKSGTLTKGEYEKYLEIDPTSSTIRVRFKLGELRDTPPIGYDIDREVYLAKRAQQEREIAVMKMVGLKRAVAEGDSWFNLPPVFRPTAIADRLISNERVHLKNIARWGHTIEKILKAKEYLTEIPKFKPDYFIFSAGGNDLQNSLEKLVLLLPYDAARPLKDSISPKGTALLAQIAEGYRALLNQIALLQPNLPTICYAYDYPRPTYKNGKYLGRHLTALGYPKHTQDEIARLVVNALTAAIEPVVSAFPNAAFLDCRQVTQGLKFFDDFHPDEDAFGALAHKFEKAMGVDALISHKRTSRKRGTITQLKSRKSRPRMGSAPVRSGKRPKRKPARRK